MSEEPLNQRQVATLAALADGIIPPDQTDGGASGMNAGARLAEKIRAGINTALYLRGIEAAETIAARNYRREVSQLGPSEVYAVIAAIREKLPGFFKQLRMDVSALYLSDPGVWQRIGFPGPSTASGGYPDFDQPQTERVMGLKEGSRPVSFSPQRGEGGG